MTSDSASAVNNASVCPYDATSTTAWLFGSSPGVPGPSGHTTRSLSAPILNASPARATIILTPRCLAAARADRSSGLSLGIAGSSTAPTRSFFRTSAAPPT